MYLVTLYKGPENSQDLESSVISIYADEKKAYIESILYNLSDLDSEESIETLESIDSKESLNPKVLEFLKAYLNEDVHFNIDSLKQKMYTFGISFLRKLHKTSYEIQKEKTIYYVSDVFMDK